jgi:hypothetical protein
MTKEKKTKSSIPTPAIQQERERKKNSLVPKSQNSRHHDREREKAAADLSILKHASSHPKASTPPSSSS